MLASDHGASSARRSLLGNGRQSLPALSGWTRSRTLAGARGTSRTVAAVRQRPLSGQLSRCRGLSRSASISPSWDGFVISGSDCAGQLARAKTDGCLGRVWDSGIGFQPVSLPKLVLGCLSIRTWCRTQRFKNVLFISEFTSRFTDSGWAALLASRPDGGDESTRLPIRAQSRRVGQSDRR
jgi:hypothetical protein